MKSIVSELLEKTKVNSSEYRPIFYKLSDSKDETTFLNLLNSNNNLRIHDEIHNQVEELIKCKNPKTVFTKESLRKAANEFFENTNKDKYGLWVFYPWSNRLIHLLDEEEFVFVRTSRNQYKITPEEKKILATKKIGVIGLSVGQSVSITLAMERGCGELRLADFDVLELTNLNRIRTGVQNLGLAKVYSVAREIAEIDPYLKVVCFPEGITEKNMDDFFTANGKLDLLIEESDGFDIKILSRYKARELQIPVLMEASDKCMIDVERFDLEPKRSILHGLVEHLDINTLKSLKTNEEKIPYMLDVLGLETASLRLKASMLEIEQSINTWPQLASAVTMGGGITADISRRILLNQYHESGRYHIDIEELVGDKELYKKVENKFKNLDHPDLSINEMESAVKAIDDAAISDINDNDLNKIIEAAIIAPSAGNNQPWKFMSFQKKLFLFHDKKQSISWADHKNLISYISLGTAIENINLKSRELGYEIKSDLFPLSDNDALIAAFTFKKNQGGETKNGLHEFIATRCTNRKRGKYSNIDESILEDIRKACNTITEASVLFTDKKEEIEKISKIVSVAERVRFLNPQGHHDFYSKELKWPSKNNSEILEGLDVKTLELNNTDEVGLRVAADPMIIELLNTWKAGFAFEKLSYKSILTSSAIGLICLPAYTKENWINGGRAVQRVWLSATKNELAFQPISAPLFLNLQIQNGGSANFSAGEKADLEKCYSELQTIFPCLEKNSGLFLFRLSHADKPSARSLRKNIDDLYFKI